MIEPGQSLSASATAARLLGSRLFVGSSSSSRLLRPTISIASASFVFSPPDSVPACWNTLSPDSPNMPSRPRSSVSVRVIAGRHLGADVVEQRLADAQVVVLLGVVAGGHVVPELERAPVGRRLAGEDPQQRRLAGAVEPEHEQALAAPEVERHVGEDVRSAVRLGEADGLDDRASGGRRGREADAQRPVALADLDPVVLDAGDPLLDAVGHRRLRRLGAEAVDDGLQPGDLLALPGGDLGGAPLVLGAGAHVLRVGAAVLDERARWPPRPGGRGGARG